MNFHEQLLVVIQLSYSCLARYFVNYISIRPQQWGTCALAGGSLSDYDRRSSELCVCVQCVRSTPAGCYDLATGRHFPFFHADPSASNCSPHTQRYGRLWSHYRHFFIVAAGLRGQLASREGVTEWSQLVGLRIGSVSKQANQRERLSLDYCL